MYQTVTGGPHVVWKQYKLQFTQLNRETNTGNMSLMLINWIFVHLASWLVSELKSVRLTHIKLLASTHSY